MESVTSQSNTSESVKSENIEGESVEISLPACLIIVWKRLIWGRWQLLGNPPNNAHCTDKSSPSENHQWYVPTEDEDDFGILLPELPCSLVGWQCFYSIYHTRPERLKTLSKRSPTISQVPEGPQTSSNWYFRKEKEVERFKMRMVVRRQNAHCRDKSSVWTSSERKNGGAASAPECCVNNCKNLQLFPKWPAFPLEGLLLVADGWIAPLPRTAQWCTAVRLIAARCRWWSISAQTAQ